MYNMILSSRSSSSDSVYRLRGAELGKKGCGTERYGGLARFLMVRPSLQLPQIEYKNFDRLFSFGINVRVGTKWFINLFDSLTTTLSLTVGGASQSGPIFGIETKKIILYLGGGGTTPSLGVNTTQFGFRDLESFLMGAEAININKQGHSQSVSTHQLATFLASSSSLVCSVSHPLRCNHSCLEIN
jgi:hypothetical protein